MYIILIAHIPGNKWTLWIPARFGFSDATEIFVFCSGMASAIAFGGVFARAGWAMGALRILHRMWQVYWAHIGVFFTILLSMVLLNATGLFEKDYIGSLNLYPFVNQTAENLLGLMTLTYVPNYFDILPMYMVILAMLPVVMMISRLHVSLVLAFVAGIYGLAHFDILWLPAEPWSDREWFFNPFAWQLVFFTGFAFMRGWIPAPPIRLWLVIVAVAVILLSMPTAYFRLYQLEGFEFLREWRTMLRPVINKTDFGLFRYAHFLALAYLAYAAAGEGGHRLLGSGFKAGVIAVCRKVGQQSLAVFLVSMALARALGLIFDIVGVNYLTAPLVNCFGLAVVIATAYFVAWFKSQPWKVARATMPATIPVTHQTAAEPVTKPEPVVTEPRQQASFGPSPLGGAAPAS